MERMTKRPGMLGAVLFLVLGGCGQPPGSRDATAGASTAAASGGAAGEPADGETQEAAPSEPMRPEDTETWEPEPVVVTPGRGGSPPSDAVVLFDGRDLSAWVGDDGVPAGWTVEDGAMTVAAGTGAIRTRRAFGDIQLYMEWRTPARVVGEGQERGNSGVFFMERYELQVLDSYDNRTYSNGQAGSIYKQYMPLVNASRGPGVWQRYEIVFRAPRFGADGRLTRPAYMTVFHNGVLIQDHAELAGPTRFTGLPEYEQHDSRLPLMLQDHGNPMSYRNIWVRELSAGR